MPEPALSEVMNEVLVTLSDYLVAVGGSLPLPSASFLSVDKKNPAIGNRVHTDTRVGFPIAAIKAGHLDANVQLQIWDTNPTDVEIQMNDLQSRILADKETLRTQGFIKLKNTATSVSELVSSLNAWRKTSQFNVLYEYQYQDDDGAESIIHRIPVTNDLEQHNTPDQETSTVINAIRRWDNEDALPLRIVANSAGTVVSGLNVLAFLPVGWPGEQVTIRRFNLDAAGAPNDYPNLTDFLTAVNDASAPDNNARVVFASVSDFVGALTAVGASFPLGDWGADGDLDEYQAYQILFDEPINLSHHNDIFSISYQSTSFDSDAVVYLRAKVT